MALFKSLSLISCLILGFAACHSQSASDNNSSAKDSLSKSSIIGDWRTFAIYIQNSPDNNKWKQPTVFDTLQIEDDSSYSYYYHSEAMQKNGLDSGKIISDGGGEIAMIKFDKTHDTTFLSPQFSSNDTLIMWNVRDEQGMVVKYLRLKKGANENVTEVPIMAH